MDPTKQSRKLCSTRSIVIRGGDLRLWLESLQTNLAQPGRTVELSTLLRDGLTAFRPQIEAYIRTGHTVPEVPAADLTTLVLICSKLREHGIPQARIVETLEALLEEQLCPELGEGTNPGPVAAGNGVCSSAI